MVAVPPLCKLMLVHRDVRRVKLSRERQAFLNVLGVGGCRSSSNFTNGYAVDCVLFWPLPITGRGACRGGYCCRTSGNNGLAACKDGGVTASDGVL